MVLCLCPYQMGEGGERQESVLSLQRRTGAAVCGGVKNARASGPTPCAEWGRRRASRRHSLCLCGSARVSRPPGLGGPSVCPARLGCCAPALLGTVPSCHL